MRKFIVTEILVIVALVAGFWIGKSTNSDTDYVRYYDKAEETWQKARTADTPPVTLDDEDQKRVREVRALYRQVFEKYPDSRWADDAMYQLASRIARTDEEVFALFRRLINNYPDSEWTDDALFTIAIANYKTGEGVKETEVLESANTYYDRALVLFNRLIENHPGSKLVDHARFNRAMCHYGKGQLNRTLQAFGELSEDFRDSDLIHSVVYYTGMIYTEQRKLRDARVEFNKVVSAGHEELTPLAQFGIAQTYFAEGRYDEAISSYNDVIQSDSEAKVAQDSHFYIGWAHQKMEQYDEAIDQLEEAINRYPDNENAPNSQFFVAQIYYVKGDTDGAIEAYRRVADNATFDYDTRRQAQYWIGHIHEKRNEADLAVEAYQHLIKEFAEPHQNPTHPSNKINENYIQNLQVSDF
ncbi:MAG: tetratricopeptide repeat protein [Candidatus Poribacteria bacterium]|nr:tetratricopeptide repeat protein [Candidatus Poribacteria bacterium]